MRDKALKKIASTLGAGLPDWQPYQTALIRREGIALQGLHLEGSRFDETFVPVGFVQVLSEPFPHLNLTLGERFRNKDGSDLWIEGADTEQACRRLSSELAQIEPPAGEPLTQEAALAALRRHQKEHFSWYIAVGALSVVAGQLRVGRDSLERARRLLASVQSPWAREPERVLGNWLSLPHDALPSALLEAAEETARALSLKGRAAAAGASRR